MSTEYRFEVGGTYRHTFLPDCIRAEFICTARDGDEITLAELGGQHREFKGPVEKAAIWDGFNECLCIGTFQIEPNLRMVDYILAHNFMEASE